MMARRARRNWTADEDAALRQLWPSTMPMRALMERFDREDATIRQRAATLGLGKRPRLPPKAPAEGSSGRVADSGWSSEAFERAKALWLKGDSAAQIGVALGCSRSSVIGKMSRAGVASPKQNKASNRTRVHTGKIAKARAGQPAKPRDARTDQAQLRGKTATFGALGLPAARPIKVALPPPPPAPISLEFARPFDDCPAGRCRWPLWGNVPFAAVPAEQRLYCGAPVRAEDRRRSGEPVSAVYCEGHCAIGYVPAHVSRTTREKPLPRDMAESQRYGRNGRSGLGGAA